MRYRISHSTEYAYSDTASLSQNELFLYPRETAGQHVLESGVTIQPEPQYLQKWEDYFGNIVQVFMVQHPHKVLKMEAVSVVETFSPHFCSQRIPWRGKKPQPALRTTFTRTNWMRISSFFQAR